jgi:quercetin dioxygenase-like cupin family protein
MASAGDELTNPVTGQTIIFRRTSADTGGELLELESVWTRRGNRPPLHYHPSQEEHFEVLAGELLVSLPEGERRLRAGDTLTVPAGVPHEMSATTEGETRARWETRPAMRTEELLETVFGLAQDGRAGGNGLPGPLQLIATANEYSAELRLTSPPWALQRTLFGVVAPVARIMGRKPRYTPSRRATAAT